MLLRLFFAVFPPPAIQAEIGRTLDALELPRARWVPDAQMHLTLAFLGDRGEDSVRDLARSLDRAAARQAPFLVELGELSGFPSLQRPRVLVLGAQLGGRELTSLAESIVRELEPALRPADSDNYHAHLTLARCSQAPPEDGLRALAMALHGARFAFAVEDACLVQSQRERQGATYCRLHRAALRGSN